MLSVNHAANYIIIQVNRVIFAYDLSLIYFFYIGN